MVGILVRYFGQILKNISILSWFLAYDTSDNYNYFFDKVNDPPRSSIALQFRNINPLATNEVLSNGNPAADLGTSTKDQAFGDIS